MCILFEYPGPGQSYRGKKVDNKHETPLSEVSDNLIPALMME